MSSRFITSNKEDLKDATKREGEITSDLTSEFLVDPPSRESFFGCPTYITFTWVITTKGAAEEVHAKGR